jgi:DGQHR domain-containing protein
MAELSGKDLEEEGKRLFKSIHLNCIGDLPQVPLSRIDPTGTYAKGEHLQIDYLLPVGDTCLVGEITSRNVSGISAKYAKFREDIRLLDHALSTAKSRRTRTDLWRNLGVSGSDLVSLRDVAKIMGFMLLTEVERFEVDLPPVDAVSILYRYEWNVLREYAQCIGGYAQCPFVDMFGLSIASNPHSRSVETFSAKEGQLLSAPDCFITSDRQHTCHVLTFIASPFQLLPASRVYRRDRLPTLGQDSPQRYQRMLVPDKLRRIREALLTHSAFVFPNTILAVLSSECKFDASSGILEVPARYGSINVVDGQHRLFAYADDAIRQTMGDRGRILVTAACFDGATEDYVQKFSARTFIEINTNQTKVSSAHLFGIAYEMLGKTDPGALAAHILRKVNERQNRLRGLLRTSDSPSGRIKSMEIVGSLGTLTNLDQLVRLGKTVGKKATIRRLGVEQLFACGLAELCNAGTLVERGVVCIEHYTNLVARVFSHDWPSPQASSNGSSLELTKMLAALIRLLRQFIEEGLTWAQVESELVTIRTNVMKLRRMTNYDSVLFRSDDAKIPDARARISDDFQFLHANRRRPTSIARILKKT